MKGYRLVWMVVVTLLVARGLALGIEHARVMTTVMFLLGTVAGAAWALHRHGRDGRRAGVAALVAGAVSAAVVGHAEALGAGLLLIVIMAVGSAPGVLTAYERWAAVPSRTARTVDALTRGLAPMAPGYVPAAPRLSQLTDEQLWEAWHDSEAALHALHADHRSTPTADVLELVDRRQAHLEELERRDPARVAALLAPGVPVDWDDAVRRLAS
jgi:hypothetical protein